MTETLAIWLIIAKSPKPITANQIRMQYRCKTIAQFLGKMVSGGKIRRENIAGIAHYSAVNWHGLVMQDILDIARVRQCLNAGAVR